MKYSYTFFKNGLPEWKRKKDSIFGRFLYRPVSFVFSSIAANLGISANAISYASSLVALCACTMFLFRATFFHIIGSILMIVWIIMDCIDGNIARCIQQKPFGEFADGISGYILIGFMCTFISIAVYFEGGLIIEKGTPWIVFIGAIASSSDTMMRLIYQKYKNTERKLADEGILKLEEDFRSQNSSTKNLMSIIDREFGLDIIVVMVLICSIFNTLDIAVIYCFIYYGISFVLSTLVYVRKAIKTANEYSAKINR